MLIEVNGLKNRRVWNRAGGEELNVGFIKALEQQVHVQSESSEIDSVVQEIKS